MFDLDVIGIAPGYDEDRLRSEALYVGEHEVYLLAYGSHVQSSYAVPASGPVQAWYLLRGIGQASQALVEVYDRLINLGDTPIFTFMEKYWIKKSKNFWYLKFLNFLCISPKIKTYAI